MNAQPDELSKTIAEQNRALAAAMGDPEDKPALRGVSHKYAGLLSFAVSAAVLWRTEPGLTWVAGFMGLGGITGMLMVSGAYHTTNWHPEVRVWMRRVDHVMIFVCIAGIYTCYALLLLNSALSQQLIAAFWLITLLGGLLKLVWVMAPRLISVVLYVGMSWSCILIASELQAQIGLNAILAILFTGIGISIGAVLYALAWPGPEAKVFGYHEIFHLTVVIHLAVHVWVIAEYALRVI
jgi:hemolysin III